jgi:hydroxymethylpyrimidine/phosphomethylpyrimidine kinase
MIAIIWYLMKNEYIASKTRHGTGCVFEVDAVVEFEE